MKKTFSIFKISFQQEFAYRLNFVMWRVRNVIQILIVYFLWSCLFLRPGTIVFDYDRQKILAYVFLTLIIKALVFSSRSIDIAGEIANGDITNHFLKPINYFRYWFTRDVSSKALNLIFALIELVLLFLFLRPPVFIQTSPLTLLLFLLTVAVAIVLFFSINFLVSMIAFWMPESGWGAQFLFMVIIVEFLSGATFPLDILPRGFLTVINFLPFPYLLFFPTQIYLNKLSALAIVQGFCVSVIWAIFLQLIIRRVWQKGVKHYSAEGR